MKSPDTIFRDRLRRGIALLPWLVAGAMLAYAFIAGGYFVTVMSFAMIYAVFVIACAVHAPIGVANIVAEATGGRGSTAAIVASVLALAILAMGLRAVYGVVAP